jgi:beta-galactosidase
MMTPYIWEDPAVQEINRLPMRSPLLPFPSVGEALRDAVAGPEYREPGENPWYLDLDGQWQFRLLPNPLEDGGPADPFAGPPWAGPGAGAGSWAAIQVPGAWSRQGGGPRYEGCFDKPHYTNVQMPFQAVPPRAPADNPTGLYRRTFDLPGGWKGRRVVLHIGSAESVCLVYINGTFAGAGKDTRLPQEYDISPFVHEGENVIGLTVVRYSDASYVEDQDQWWFGGIHRGVFLYSTAECFIRDVKALPGKVEGLPERKSRDPGEAYGAPGETAGTLTFSVTLGGRLPEARSTGSEGTAVTAGNPAGDPAGSPFTIVWALYPFRLPSPGPDGTGGAESARRIAGALLEEGPAAEGTIVFDCSYRLNSNTAEGTIRIGNPALWSHEFPNLYVLTVKLVRDGRNLESAALLTGFRNVRIGRRELLINERPVLIKGVNRHEHDEKTGKTLSTESMLQDIRLLKTHHFNAVRTCHYPDDERWYELCDRYGIYLVDEANIEHHCFYNQMCQDSAWNQAYMRRVIRMAERDKNHPAVILWSLGNESGDGENHSAAAAWLRRLDPGRPLNYEGAIRPEGGQGAFTLESLNRGRDLTDIISPMYPPLDLIVDFVKYREDDRPLIMIEYSHAMGNSNGSLADYWKAIESYHGLQGGFIWEWIDHGLEAFTPEGKKYWKYGGDFGDVPSDLDFVCDGLLFPDRSPKPAMAECKALQAPVRLKPVPGRPLRFTLENRYDFSGLDHLDLRWKLCTETAPLVDTGETVLREGGIPLPALRPGASAELGPEGIDLRRILEEHRGAVYLHFDFVLKRDTPWAGAGFVVARGERLLRESLPPELLPGIAVSGTAADPAPPAAGTAAAGPAAGTGPAEFAASFEPSLFRAPTQNDGLKTFMHLRGDPAARFYCEGKAMYPWLDMDLMHLGRTGERNETAAWQGYRAAWYTAVLTAGPAASAEYRDARLGTYTRIIAETGGGRAVMDITFDLDPGLPELPRVGIRARVPARYGTIAWFGAGEGESYPDRRAAAFLGHYTGTPAGLEVPYVVPQENGNRGGVRSLTLRAAPPPAGPAAITIRPCRPVSFGVSRYRLENLTAALHTPDLADLSLGEDGYYFLSIDIAQRGVGTATCGPDTRPEYRLHGGLYRMRLYFS